MQRNIQRTLLVLFFGCCLPTVSSASAVEAKKVETTIEETSAPAPSTATQADSWGDKTPPKGYVASKAPTKNKDAYLWKQMGLAGVVMAGMIFFLIWLIRRNTRGSGDEHPRS